MKKRFIEIAVKVVVAALTAFLTAITTTSCMGYGPLYGPLPKIVQISQMKNPLAVAGGFSVKYYTVGTPALLACYRRDARTDPTV